MVYPGTGGRSGMLLIRWDVSCDLNESRDRAEMMPLETVFYSLGPGTAKEASYMDFKSFGELFFKGGMRQQILRRT